MDILDQLQLNPAKLKISINFMITTLHVYQFVPIYSIKIVGSNKLNLRTKISTRLNLNLSKNAFELKKN